MIKTLSFCLAKLCFVLLVSILPPSVVHGQTTAARPDRGTMPNGSYSVSDLENISLSNGNVNLTIPLASLPPMAGGKLSWTLNAYYNSKIWDVVRTQAIGTAFDLSQHYYVIDSVQPSDRGGWRITGQYGIEIRSAQQDFDYQLPPVADQDYTLMLNHNWYKAVLIMPDGAEHELRPVDYAPFPGAKEFLFGYYKQTPATDGTMRYYSFDGSYLYATITASGEWTVYLPDGTRIIQTLDGVQRIQDTNGNKIKIFTDSNGTHYQDELTGREIRYLFNPTANDNKGQGRVSYQTVDGNWEYIDINFDTTHVQGQLYRVNGWKHGQLSEEPCTYLTELNRELQVVAEIVLPETEPTQPNRRFSFNYNSETTESATNTGRLGSCDAPFQSHTRQASKGWGSLSRVVTPAGAEIQYSYSLDSGAPFAHLPLSPDDIAGETITKKTIVQDGPDDIWTYSIFDTGGAQTYLADNSTIAETKYAQGASKGTGFGGAFFGVSGLVYRSTRPFSKTERHWTNLVFTNANLNSPGGTVAFNPVVDAEYTTLTDASGNALKMSAKTFQHDYNGNVTQTTEYDWFSPASVNRDGNGVPTGVPPGATVLRVINHTYYNPATSASSANVYAKRAAATGAPLILDAEEQTTIGPRIERFSYDGQAWGVAPTQGNLTSKSVWDDLDNKWITTSNTYDLYGNVSTTTDGRGKFTQYFYDDATHALPTRVIVDPQNGTGTQTTTSVYDFSTGLVLSQTDPNGQQSTIDYINPLLGRADPFGRPGMTKSPPIDNHQRRVTTTYLDSSRQVIVATDLNAENDQLVKTRTTTDKLGRPVLTEQTEDGTNYTISSRNAYLDMGRVTLTSSAMRGAASSTDSWTRVTNDVAGRVIEVATFGGAGQPAWTGTAGTHTGSVSTVYDENFTTVTDQAGKVRRTMVDALGRLVRVDEPNAAGSLGSTTSPVQPTSYVYDTLGNLTNITQDLQGRWFTYDSLSRLRTALNPESGTISYQYDDSNNLVVKTDARGVSTHFEYDGINRVTRRWYNGSNSVSHTVHNDPQYPIPTGVGVTNEARFFYDTQSLPGGAPFYSRGAAVGRLVAQTYGSGTNGDYFAYDNLGRQKLKYQQMGTVNYLIEPTYNLAGAITSLKYPSNNIVLNTYDQAGRLLTFAGNLASGGSTRTYSSGILYSPTGAVVKEQFGTDTAIYNHLLYNSRTQLAEIRASTSANQTDPWDRGAIINNYSSQCTGVCSNSAMPDNNGNLKKQEIHIPGHTMRWQEFDYDSLNRLNWSREVLNGGAEQWKQQFTYDRWGNRLIDTVNTYGLGINNKNFIKQDATNRLYAPGDLALAENQRQMRYDAAGNLTHDVYTGAGNRTYDGENKITSAWGGNNQAQLYAYDSSGQRIKRTVDGVETWQVYGLGGELLAEYPVNGVTTSPQKEYGYRNGQLLVTAEASSSINVALASNGAAATASSAYNPAVCGSSAASANDGDRTGRARCSNRVWNDAAPANTFPDWLQIDFNGSKTISEIDVITVQDHIDWPVEPTESMTFSQFGLTAYEVQYWNGSSWVTIPSGSVGGNNKVWRKFTFAAIDTTKIRVLASASADGYSRLVEVEAWTGPSPAPRPDLALGATATSSSNYPGWGASGVVNGDRKSLNAYSNGAWSSAAANNFPEWVQVDFGANKTIDEIHVFTLQDIWAASIEPTEATTFTLHGLSGYEVQYWTGSSWATVPGGNVTSNNKIWRKFTFSPISTSKIRVLSNAAPDGVSRLTEIEAYGPTESGGSSGLQWLVTDHLGTPRMIFGRTGDLASIKRHDYLPFGEKLFAPAGGRTAAMGYSGGDGVRQQFTAKERDFETALDYFLARYYSSTQGRFTSPDEFTGGPDELYYFADVATANPTFYADLRKPQSLNKYQYAYNNPLRFVDPDGHDPEPVPDPQDPCGCKLTPKQLSELLRDLEKLDEVTSKPLFPITDRIGTSTPPTIDPIPIPPIVTPAPIQPNLSPAQPAPPPPPVQARPHRSNRRRSTRDKHQKVRPGKKQPPNYTPFRRPPPKPKPTPEPKTKPEPKPELGPDGNPINPPQVKPPST